MDPLTVSMDVPDTLGGLRDEQHELSGFASQTAKMVVAKIGYLQEMLGPNAPPVNLHIETYHRILRRLRVLAAARDRTFAALDTSDVRKADLLRFLRAALEEGVYLSSLGEDIRSELPVETLDRFAVLFQRLAGRQFESAAGAIASEAAAPHDAE